MTSILLASRRLPMWAKYSIDIFFHSALRWHRYKTSALRASHNASPEQRTDTLIRSSLCTIQIHASESSSNYGGFDPPLTHRNLCIFLSLPISRPPMDRRNLNLTNPNLLDVKLALLPSCYWNANERNSAYWSMYFQPLSAHNLPPPLQLNGSYYVVE